MKYLINKATTRPAVTFAKSIIIITNNKHGLICLKKGKNTFKVKNRIPYTYI